MEKTRAHEIMVEVLQKALTGKVNDNINLHDIADAIAAKVEFEKSYSSYKNDKIAGQIIDAIISRNAEMKAALNDITDKDETLLQNFINGKLTAYTEILNITNNL